MVYLGHSRVLLAVIFALVTVVDKIDAMSRMRILVRFNFVAHDDRVFFSFSILHVPEIGLNKIIIFKITYFFCFNGQL